MNPHKKPSERMKVCLKFQAFYEDAQRRINRRVPEIFQARPAPRLGAHRFTFEQPELATDAIDQGSVIR
jgi:hypothetical protein